MTTETLPVPAAETKPPLAVAPVTWAVVGLAVVLCFLKFGFSGDAVVGSILAAALVVVAATDLEHRIIPNRIVVPASAVVLLLNIAVHPSHWVEWLVAAAASFAFFLVVALVNPKGLGMGDVKLAFLIGAGLGWDVVGALILGTFAAAVYAVILVLTRPGASGKTSFAMGPFLAGAAVVVLLLAH
jgi:leader peptidase (prepilin peptidase) / N-methyltransferase